MSNLSEPSSTNPKDPEFKNFLLDQGFLSPRRLEDGEWVAMLPLMFTMSVCCGIGEHHTYRYRWCFGDREEAELFLAELVDFDDIPTKKDSLKGHRYLTTPRYMETDQLGINKW